MITNTKFQIVPMFIKSVCSGSKIRFKALHHFENLQKCTFCWLPSFLGLKTDYRFDQIMSADLFINKSAEILIIEMWVFFQFVKFKGFFQHMHSKYTESRTLNFVSFNLILDAFPLRPKIPFGQRNVAICINNICKWRLGPRVNRIVHANNDILKLLCKMSLIL